MFIIVEALPQFMTMRAKGVSHGLQDALDEWLCVCSGCST